MHLQHHLRAVAMLAATGLVLAACTGGASSEGEAENAAMIALEADESPTYILPSDPQCTAVNNHYLRRLLWRPLYWYGGVPGDEFALNEQLSLAEPPDYSDDGKQVTVTLKDFNWSDGQPVTARDVEFFVNLYQASKKEWGCYSPGGLPDNIEKMTLKDDKTIVFTLDRGYSPDWLTVNVLAEIVPMPQHAWDKTSEDGDVGDHDQTKDGGKAVFDFLTEQAKSVSTYASNPLWQVVNGPWRLQAWDPRGDIVFEPNEKYSGPDKPKLSRIVEKRFTTDEAEYNALLSGDELTTGYIPSQNAAQVERVTDLGYRSYQSGNFGISYIQLNWQSNAVSALFHQHYIRQALQHMINQPQYVKVAYNGNAAEVHGPVPTKPENPYVSDYVKSVPYKYDPQAAVRLLEENGWTVNPDGASVCTNPGTGDGQCGEGVERGQEFTFRLVYAKGVQSDQMMQAFKSSAARAGITVQLRQATLDQVFSITNICKKGKRQCDWDAAYYGGWTFGPYPTGENLYLSGASENNYSDPKADELILATKTEPGKQHMTEYQDYVAEQIPELYMPREQGGLNVVDSGLKGYERDEQALFGDIYPQYWYFSE
ncbi:MAG: hypothetical protein GEV03_05440 [Streptosporangiales bacterium]|nr:hypothetical protein [Streptosporangiales bacterium]